jgi:FkbM family methyltransferase
MLSKLIKEFLDKRGVVLTLKKNLWYLDAYAVQGRIITNERPVIFDVGASEGSVVKKYKSIYPAATIHAFEPQPDSFHILKQTTSAMEGVHYTNAALSNTLGKMPFYRTNSYASSSLLPAVKSGSFVDNHTGLAEKYDVDLDTLDNYVSTHSIAYVDILKMDVQGNELNILKGGEGLLKRGAIGLVYSEVWFTKAYEQQPFYEDIAMYLREFGYLPFGLYNMHWDLKLKGKNLWADAIFIKNQ